MAAIIAAVLLCLAGLTACGKAGSRAPQGLGLLTPYLDIGTRGVWTGALSQGVYSLSNSAEPRALRTIILQRTEDQRFSMAVDIAFAGAQSGGEAGLVLSYDPGDNRYYVLSLQPGGTVILYRRTPNDLKIELEDKVALRSGFNRLEFDGIGNTIAVKVNGETIATHVAQNLGSGSAGIAALGVGTFLFTNFAATGYKADDPAPNA